MYKNNKPSILATLIAFSHLIHLNKKTYNKHVSQLVNSYVRTTYNIYYLQIKKSQIYCFYLKKFRPHLQSESEETG